MLMGTELKLSDLHTSVIIPSYELEASSPFTFWHKHSPSVSNRETGYIAMVRSEDLAGKNTTQVSGRAQLVKGPDFKLWEVARASSAAPTYFPGEIDCALRRRLKPALRGTDHSGCLTAALLHLL